ncbi:hypothetical protein P3L10_033628 [Capsicum annuum]
MQTDAKEEDVKLQLWIKQVQDLAHDAQDILEKHVFTCSNFQEKGSWSWRKQHHSSMAEKILKAQSDRLSMLLEGIKARISVISEGHKSFLQKYGVATSAESSNATWCSNHEEVPLDNDIDLIGIEYHKSVFLDRLLPDDPRWKLLCVAGTRGIGTTALVKKVYNDASVKKHFDSLLWIDVSRFSNVKELLTSMITPDNDQTRRAIDAMDANILGEVIEQVFESSRYFVVLDDSPDIVISIRVLDLTGAPLVKIPEVVFELFHLKFLNLRRTKIKHLPGSIGKLESLEFLDLRDTLVDKLSVEMVNLQHLRHIFIYRRGAGFFHGFKALEKIGTLVSLEVVNLINASTSTVIELGKLTRLRQLIANLRGKHGRDLCTSLNKLTNLQQLSISSYGVSDIIGLHYPLSSTHSFLRKLTFEGRLERFPIWVTSLHALTTVVLKWSKLMDNAIEWSKLMDNAIDTLQDLPNLVTLVLDQAYDGEKLTFRTGGFEKLKELQIMNSTKLRQMKVEEGAMPSLEKLEMRNCRLMEELPLGIEHLSKLQYLLLDEIGELLVNCSCSQSSCRRLLEK